MGQRVPWHKAGFTLLEITLALAVFTIIMGATAQALITYYVALDMQNQRTAAVEACRGLLSDMRDLRDNNSGSFPESVTTQWPDGATVPIAGLRAGQSMRVDYVNPQANPLEVRVTAQWMDIQGHPVSVSLSTVLTDR